MTEKIKEYWNKGNKEKVILTVVFGIVFFIFYRIIKSIIAPKKSESLEVTATTTQPRASGLIYGTTGTNTDVGYLNDEKFAGINENFSNIESRISSLMDLQEFNVQTISDVNEDLNEKISRIAENQTGSQNVLDRLYDYADQITKYKEEYTKATTIEDKQRASQGASRVRQIALNYAKQNNLSVDETYYPNELLQSKGYTEYTIEGIAI